MALLEHGEGLRPAHRALLGNCPGQLGLLLGQHRGQPLTAANDDVGLAGGQGGLARHHFAHRARCRLHLEQLLANRWQILGGKRLGIQPQARRDQADHWQVVVVYRNPRAALAGPDRQQIIEIGGIDPVGVVGDGVVAELLGHRIGGAIDAVAGGHHHLGEEVVGGQLVIRQRGQQAGFDGARHVDGIDHQHVPVAGPRLLEHGKGGTGTLILAQIDGDSVGLLEGLDQRGIGVVAPHQGIEAVLGLGGHRRQAEQSTGGQAGGLRKTDLVHVVISRCWVAAGSD
nr:hypothetical protein [Halomonas socia]